MSARTEAPTPRRLTEARSRGEVAVSRELTGAVALAAGLGALAATGAALEAELAGVVRGGLEAALRPGAGPTAVLQAAALDVARLSAWPAAVALAAALLAGALQSGGLLAPAALAPRLERLSPGRGLARLLSWERFTATSLGVVKAGLLGALLAGWLRRAVTSLAALPGSSAPAQGLAAVLAPLVPRLLAGLLLLGVADLVRARRRHLRDLRMTREEVRRERREEEGDPRHRAERRQLHQALLSAPALARATCVVVNPTHLAVALWHRRERDEAPRVIAKGAGPAARRIRSEARRAGVPIVRDVPLARALHRLAEVGDEIPEELFDAAAAVLAHLYRAPAPEP